MALFFSAVGTNIIKFMLQARKIKKADTSKLLINLTQSVSVQLFEAVKIMQVWGE